MINSKRFWGILLLMTAALLFLWAAGCGGSKKDQKKDPESGSPTQVPPEAQPGVPQLTYGSKDIAFRIQADSMLNLFDGKAHTAVMAVYQVDDPNGFKGLAQDQDGLRKLLESQSFGSSCLSAQKVIVHPGELQNLVMDRAKGAQWVCIAVGYYSLNPGDCTRMYKIPLNEIKKGLILKKKYLLPGRLYVKLILDPTSIRSDSGPTTAPPSTEDVKPAAGQPAAGQDSQAQAPPAPKADDSVKQVEGAVEQEAKSQAEQCAETELKKIIKN